MGSDLTVVNAARVSFAKQSEYEEIELGWEEGEIVTSFRLAEKDRKLIDYLATHGHWSPFAHAFLQFRIKAPIFVARQLVKHQVGLSWNEVSRRYVDDEPEFYMPDYWREKPTNSKQGSGGAVKNQSLPTEILTQTHRLAQKHYNLLIEQGVAPEMARMVLPQSMMTEWYWSGSLHAFARVCKQRQDHDAQMETQAIAGTIADACQEKFPVSWSALLAQ